MNHSPGYTGSTNFLTILARKVLMKHKKLDTSDFECGLNKTKVIRADLLDFAFALDFYF